MWIVRPLACRRLLLLAVLWAVPAGARPQETTAATPASGTTATEEGATEEAATVDRTEPRLSLSEIPAKRLEVQSRVLEARRRLQDTAALESARDALRPIEQNLESVLSRMRLESARSAEVSDLMDLDSEAWRYELKLDGLIERLTDEASWFETAHAEFGALRQEWLRYSAAVAESAPDELARQVSDILATIDDVIAALESRRDEYLVALVRTNDLASQVEEYREEAAAAREKALLQSMTAAGRPIWGVGLTAGGEELAAHVRGQLKSDVGHLASYLRDNSRILTTLFAGTVLLVFIAVVALRRAATRLPSGSGANEILGSTLTLSLIVGLLTMRLLSPPAPKIYYQLLLLALLPFATQLAFRTIGTRPKVSILAVVGALFFFPLRAYLDLSPLFDRVILLAQCALVAAALAFDLRRGHWQEVMPAERRRLGTRLLWTAVVLLSIAFVAGVVGAIGVARTLRDGVIGSLGAALAARSTLRAVNGFVAAWLARDVPHSIRVLDQQPETVRRGIYAVMSFVLLVIWVWVSLWAFGIRDELLAWMRRVGGWGLTAGDVNLTVATVLTFAGVFVGSLLLARFICWLLEDEFLPRLDLGHGLPYAIATLTRYLILIVGFMLALGAAGIDLTKVSLLLGAFGVGIGLGLQSVVNNFVSGLILLFERPIQVGDAVEVEGLLGRVGRIGIRASTLETYDGAEVIVPNGDLISKRVVNWTLSTRRRRVEVDVGVAYETDLERAIEVMTRTAREHPGISSHPEPDTIVKGFGDSAVDLQLRCWVDNFDDSIRVGSTLRASLHARLQAEGIEIPFPQLDVRLAREAVRESGERRSSQNSRESEP